MSINRVTHRVYEIMEDLSSFRKFFPIFPSCVASIIFFLFSMTCFSQISLDGTLGSSGTLTGPNFDIPAELGQQVGGNLFHSFSDFNLSNGESATFSGPNTVQNILSRVTGTNPSNIDGLIQSTIQDANFYFLNPNGVMFGPNAQIDISGSFTVSTADYLGFSDQGRFDAKTPEMSSLTSAPADTFGFMDNLPSPIEIEGSFIEVGESKSVTIIGGDLSISNGQLMAPGGNINFVSIDSVGDVLLNSEDSGESTFNTENFSMLGDISLSGDSNDTSKIEIDNKNGGGSIQLIGNDLDLSGFRISAETTGTVIGGDIFIELRNNLSMNRDSRIRAIASGSAPGGNVIINTSGDVVLDTQGFPELTVISTGSRGDIGNAGDIELDANSISILGEAFILSGTEGDGSAGNVILSADSLSMEGSSSIFPALIGTQTATGSGPAGNVKMKVNALTMIENSQIGASTFGFGNAGSISIKGLTIQMEGNSRIAADTQGEGKAGKVDIQVGSISMKNGSKIRADTRSAGIAGMVHLNVESLNISNDLSVGVTNTNISAGTSSLGHGGIVNVEATKIHIEGELASINASSNLFSDGDAGNINIEVDSLQILDGGEIDASTFGFGKGGNISIQAKDIHLSAPIAIVDPSISSSISVATIGLEFQGEILGGNQQAGNIKIETSSLTVEDGSFISANNAGLGDSGSVEIISDELTLSGLLFNESSITVNSNVPGVGNGGTIKIHSKNVSLLDWGQIRLDTFGSGNAGSLELTAEGNLTISGRFALIDGDSGSDENSLGNGGNLLIEASKLEVINGGSVTSTTFGAGKGGIININVEILQILEGGHIDVNTSSTGDGGILVITASQIEIVGSSPLTGFDSRITSRADLGEGGKIFIFTDQLTLSDFGTIQSDSFISSGSGGEIQIVAQEVEMSQSASVSADTFRPFTIPGIINEVEEIQGNAGSIDITAINLKLDDSVISSSNRESTGDGGKITINSGNIDITGSFVLTGGRITTQTSGGGDGGDIKIFMTKDIGIEDLHLKMTQIINGNALAEHIQKVTLDIPLFSDQIGGGSLGGLNIQFGRIQSDSVRNVLSPPEIGSAGDIEIRAVDVNLLDFARISSLSNKAGDTGNITIISSDDLTLSANSNITVEAEGGNGGSMILTSTNLLLESGSEITAEASNDGGIVELKVGKRISLTDSNISSEAGNNGGNINIDPEFVILNNSRITANAILGNGGNIDIITDFLIQSDDSSITASSQFGLNGSIFVSGPELDLSGSLVALEAEIFQQESRLPEHCAVRLPGGQSSFIQAGKGGLPWMPNLFQESHKEFNEEN